MSWVKLDDRFPDNPKIAPLSDRAFVAYVTSICYCARELTDGFIPLKTARMYAGKPGAVKELTPQLWEPCPGGFQVHDFLKYNLTRAAVLAERESARRRMSRRTSPEIQGEQQAEVQPHPYPVNPVPSLAPVDPPPDPEPSAVAVKEFWEGRIGPLSPNEATQLETWTRKVGETWVYEAIEEAGERADTPWPYFVGTLERCVRDGRSPKGKKRPKLAAIGSVSDVLKQKQSRRN